MCFLQADLNSLQLLLQCRCSLRCCSGFSFSILHIGKMIFTDQHQALKQLMPWAAEAQGAEITC